MNLIGKVLGNRYEIIEEIGIGGMAAVYKAKCKLLNRNVAIKILKDEFANDSEFIKRFQVEAQAAASLSHPNIVSIYDVGNENNMHYIVMEFIEGKTLKEIICESGRLDWKYAADIAMQIAAGLSKAHANHIVHRDIKPHNIIITKDKVAKVTDFGIAKAVSNSTINAFGSNTMGSVHYFSPEHARGGYTDEKSDIYSLGIVLYEMVTGKLPFDADSPVSIAMKHLQEMPMEPININKDLPIGINNIILKAMAKNISDRYQTANEMYNDLERILKAPSEIPETVVAIKKNNEFPTQKIPIVGVEKKVVPLENRVTKNNFEEEDNNMKKGITKKQAVVRIIIILIIAVGLFFAAFKLGNYMFSQFDWGNETDVQLPKVIGLEKEEAKRQLEELGLVMIVAGQIESDDYPEGYIVRQEHAEGYRLKKGAEIDVYVSKGGKKVFVPDVTGMAERLDMAKILIEQTGLVMQVEEVHSDKVPSGEIADQLPKLNTEVSVGSTVIVYVSKGIQAGLVKVPYVVGEAEEAATKKLSDSKLIPEVTSASDSSKANGIVISQSIEKDSIVSELTKIVITVNKVSDNKDEDKPNNDNNKENENPLTNGKKRTIKINLANKGSRSDFVVKVVLQSTLIGTRVEYEGTHSRADGTISVDITDAPGAYLRLYIDGALDSEQVLQ